MLIALLVAQSGSANPSTGTVEGAVTLKGKAEVGAPVVVYIDGEGPPAVVEGNKQVAQRLQAFEPRGLLVAKGDMVAFPNRDTLFHNVFSDEPGASFNLGVYGPDTSKEQRLDRAGPVHVWCHRHEEMSMQVLVLPNAWYAMVEDGKYTIEGVPPGDYELVAWTTEFGVERTKITVTADAATVQDFHLVRERFMRRAGYEN